MQLILFLFLASYISPVVKMITFLSVNDDVGIVLLSAVLLPIYTLWPIILLMHVSRRITSGLQLREYHEDNHGYMKVVNAMTSQSAAEYNRVRVLCPDGIPIYEAATSGTPEETGETIKCGEVVSFASKQELESDHNAADGETNTLEYLELCDGRGWLL